VLRDRGIGYSGNREHHEYALYLDVENIDRPKTKAKSPRTNGICERFNKTRKDEFYSAAFRKKVHRSIAELQLDLDQWVRLYNEERTHGGKHCYGKTPVQTFIDFIPLAGEKLISYDVSDGQPA
jgi:transposase InsO family protein